LYGRVSLVNFIIIINFILLLILFFNISFVFKFVYGLNPIPDLFDIIILPEYYGIGTYNKFNIFKELYYAHVEYNIKHPGVYHNLF
jgi:hypothetical protein